MTDSTPDNRRDAIQSTYEDATLNYYNDMASTTTAEEAQAVETNYHRAELMWLASRNAALARNGAQVEAAYDALNKANKAVAKARQSQQKLAELPGKVASAIKAGTKLTELA